MAAKAGKQPGKPGRTFGGGRRAGTAAAGKTAAKAPATPAGEVRTRTKAAPAPSAGRTFPRWPKAWTASRSAPGPATKAKPASKARPAAAKKPGPPAEPKPRPRTRPAPAPRTPEQPPTTPLLQRRSWYATLARVLVLTVAIVCMVAFAVALAKVTLVPSPSSDALIHTNLKPGDSIRAYLDQPNVRDTVKQIGGNILLGVPFGILLPVLFPKARGLLRVAVLTALVMLLVETTQGAIVEGRAFDIDDVILNTSGALIGYLLLGLRLGRALHPRRRHWWHRWFGGQDRARQRAAARSAREAEREAARPRERSRLRQSPRPVPRRP
ncbi:VanZ family protein [Actinacidiphila alni]|uniref:VanZ family protein n=1 Tax=Actinacidiphila alni TaxID=380248 RepID=UPI003455891F